MNSQDRKAVIIKDTSKYSLAQYAAQAIGFLTAFFMRKFLGPYQMGIWSLLKVAQGYLGYLQLGVESAAVYRIPFYKGKSDVAAETETKDTAFSFMFLMSVFSSIALAIAALLVRKHYPLEVIVGLLSLALYVILQRLYSFYIITLRAYRNFSVLTKSLLFDAIVNLILVVLLVKFFKIYGLYITISILAVLNTLFVGRLSGYKLNFKFVFKRFKELTVYGFPLLIGGFLGEILSTIDSIMIAKMMGVVFVGYYSVALMTKNCIYGLSNNLGIVTIPHMQEVYGKSGDMEEIKKFVTHSVKVISYLLSPILGITYFIAPFFVTIFLPKYIPGIAALQILLLNTFFLSCSAQSGQFLVTIGKQSRLIIISVAAIILNIFFNFYFIKIGLGISGVALGTSFSSFFVFTAMLIYAMKHFANFRDIFKFIVNILLAPFYMISIIYFCDSLKITGLSSISLLTFQLIVMAFASLPLVIYINKETGVLHLIFEAIVKRFK
ncbi:MAG: oligosaccharide flippase family protein [Candidatus Omnitrophota bacterium]